MTETDAQVLIVGAGPTGLVLALWLTRLGVRVRIVDRTAQSGTTSRALAVQARTLELYQQVGLSDAVVASGVLISAVNLWVGGQPVARVPLGRLGEAASPFPFVLTYAQDVHERMLEDTLATLGVRVERNTELVAMEQDATQVIATLRLPDGTRERCLASYLAGCDGASSFVRKQLGAGFPGSTYAGVFYVADVIAEGMTSNEDIHLELGASDFLAVFPLMGAGHLRLIGPYALEPSARDEVPTFPEIGARALADLGLRIASVQWFSTYRVHHRVASRFRDRRTFLLGDAAHVHSPVGGQGMNTGIGDAVNLAWKLAAVIHREAGEQVLETFETERRAFAERLVATTDRAFTLVTSRGTIARFIRTRVAPRVAPAAFRLGWVRRALFRVVSQIGVHYRHSALSEGGAGRVRGGDRLPWIATDAGLGNFAPLASLTWQVHVYGEARPALVRAAGDIGVPVHAFAWDAAMHAAGVRRDAAYLVRPDGYVALADPAADAERLRAFWKRLEPLPPAR